jgi:hypothetical protein
MVVSGYTVTDVAVLMSRELGQQDIWFKDEILKDGNT